MFSHAPPERIEGRSVPVQRPSRSTVTAWPLRPVRPRVRTADRENLQPVLLQLVLDNEEVLQLVHEARPDLRKPANVGIGPRLRYLCDQPVVARSGATLGRFGLDHTEQPSGELRPGRQILLSDDQYVERVAHLPLWCQVPNRSRNLLMMLLMMMHLSSPELRDAATEERGRLTEIGRTR